MNENTQGRKYRLVVGDGAAEKLVRTSTGMPPFVVPPKVVVWGTRFFVLDSAPDAEELVYREAFAWFAGAEVLGSPAEAPPEPTKGPAPAFGDQRNELTT